MSLLTYTYTMFKTSSPRGYLPFTWALYLKGKFMKYLTLPIIILITGCSSSDNNTEMSQFNGLWENTCSELSINNPTIGIPSTTISIYFIEHMTFNDGNYTSESTIYTDVNCTIEKIGFGNSYTGTYVVKEQVTTSSGLTPNRVTLEAVNLINPTATQTYEYLLLRQNNILYLGNWSENGTYTLGLDNPYALVN